MKIAIKFISYILYFLLYFNFADCVEELQNPNEKEPSKKKWYEFNITVPLFISSFEKVTGVLIFFILFNIGLVTLTLLPFRILDGFQSCLISSMGTFYFTTHLLARPLAAIPKVFDFVIWILGIVVATIAGVFSVNEKFSNLFLSIGGGYITSSFLVALIGFKHYMIYFLTFAVFFVGFVIFKKSNAKLHYCVVRSLVLSFTITTCVDLITPIKLFQALYGESGKVIKIHKYIGYAMFFTEIFLIFTYTFYKSKIQNAVRKK